MESPNQYLSPEPFFARIAPTSFEIQGSKVCSTVRPLPLPHSFGRFQGNHVWKAPTSTFHHNLFLPGLLQPVSRSKGPKCARLSAPCHRHNKHNRQFMADWLVVLKNTVKVHFLRRCRRAGNWNVSPKSGVAAGGLAQGAMTQTGASAVGGRTERLAARATSQLRGGARPLWGGSQWE